LAQKSKNVIILYIGEIMTKQVQHFDRLGRELAVGDVVTYNSFYNGGLTVGRIERLMKVRAEIHSFVDNRSRWGTSNIEPINCNDTIKLDPKEISFWLLKHK
jgi:hypothetical protein